MDAANHEFLAEREIVKVVPNFTHGKLYLIAGDVGPFTAGLQCEVPLWLAINLRQRGKCKIVPPSWMDLDALVAKKEEETEAPGFTQMDCRYYLAVAQLILTAAPHDIPNAQLVKTLIKDIWDLRTSKLRSSVAEFIRQEAKHGSVHHLTPMELHTIQPLLPAALDQLHRFAKAANSSAHNASAVNESSHLF